MKKISSLFILRQRYVIADAQLIEQEAWLSGVGFQLAAQVADEGAQVSVFATVVWPPDALEQFAVCQDFSGIAGQFAEEFVFGRSEMHLFAAGAHLAMGEIDDEA